MSLHINHHFVSEIKQILSTARQKVYITKELERKIDGLVYGVYELTEEEI